MSENIRQPVLFLTHGAGPCFWMSWPAPVGRNGFDGLREYLAGIMPSISQTPDAIIVVSAHWETGEFSVNTNAAPGMLYDYYGFPDDTYSLQFPAPGQPALAKEIVNSLQEAGIAAQSNAKRGYDHGVFVPLMIMCPEAGIPVVEISIQSGYDPDAHIALGQVLEQYRSQNVLIVASGSSYHNFQDFFDGQNDAAKPFDDWLGESMTQYAGAKRLDRLRNWEAAPNARHAHPKEDHLIPLMAAAGAAGESTGTWDFHELIGGKAFSCFRFDD